MDGASSLLEHVARTRSRPLRRKLAVLVDGVQQFAAGAPSNAVCGSMPVALFEQRERALVRQAGDELADALLRVGPLFDLSQRADDLRSVNTENSFDEIVDAVGREGVDAGDANLQVEAELHTRCS